VPNPLSGHHRKNRFSAARKKKDASCSRSLLPGQSRWASGGLRCRKIPMAFPGPADFGSVLHLGLSFAESRLKGGGGRVDSAYASRGPGMGTPDF